MRPPVLPIALAVAVLLATTASFPATDARPSTVRWSAALTVPETGTPLRTADGTPVELVSARVAVYAVTLVQSEATPAIRSLLRPATARADHGGDGPSTVRPVVLSTDMPRRGLGTVTTPAASYSQAHVSFASASAGSPRGLGDAVPETVSLRLRTPAGAVVTVSSASAWGAKSALGAAPRVPTVVEGDDVAAEVRIDLAAAVGAIDLDNGDTGRSALRGVAAATTFTVG